MNSLFYAPNFLSTLGANQLLVCFEEPSEVSGK